jgi:hypothetical protein
VERATTSAEIAEVPRCERVCNSNKARDATTNGSAAAASRGTGLTFLPPSRTRASPQARGGNPSVEDSRMIGVALMAPLGDVRLMKGEM